VLYEMLAGKAPFDGEDISDTLANVLKAEPDWTTIPSSVPEAIRTLVRKCLDKDRRTRIADISVASFILDDPEVLGRASAPDSRDPVKPSSWRERATVPIASLILGSALTGALVWYATRPGPAPLSRLAITTSGAASFASTDTDRVIAISPDGRRVAYVGGSGTIFVRALDQLEPTALTGLGLPRGLFFSPDGQWIGFFDSAVLKKVAVSGGAPVTLCRISGVPRGASWGQGDTIVFATNDRASGLLRVPAGGGDPTVLSTPNQQNGEGDHLWPEFLPGGSALLFTIVHATSSLENARIAVFDMRNTTQKAILDRGTDAHYVSSGHLLYGQAGTARAVAFDLDRLEAKGTAVQVLPQVAITRFGAGQFDIAGDGTLVYLRSAVAANRTLIWVDRQGREEAISIPARGYLHPRLSPDGKRVAFEVQEDIWIWDVGGESLRQLTFDPAPDRFPAWTPDGRVVFGSDRTSNGMANLFVQAADGSGSVQRLTESPNQQFPMSVAPGGRWLVFRESAPSLDLMALPLDQPQQPARPLLNTAAAEQNGEISPDGRWLAYQSNESGRFEIYVRPFPKIEDGRWRVSTDGGMQPLWSKNGQELFFLELNGAVRATSVGRGSTWSAGNPTRMFEGSYFHGVGGGVGRTYDVSVDGRRFLMIKELGVGGSSDASFIVVQNWLDELKGLVPGK
jgi:hypothetical protein